MKIKPFVSLKQAKALLKSEFFLIKLWVEVFIGN